MFVPRHRDSAEKHSSSGGAVAALDNDLVRFHLTDTNHNHNETVHNETTWNILYSTDDWNDFTTRLTLTSPSLTLEIFNFTSSTLIPHKEGLFIKDHAHDFMGVSDVSTSGIKINLSFGLKEGCYYIMQIKGVNTKLLVHCFKKSNR